MTTECTVEVIWLFGMSPFNRFEFHFSVTLTLSVTVFHGVQLLTFPVMFSLETVSS